MGMDKCYAYIRVSTDKQDESLIVQEQKIRSYCQFQNLEIVDIFVDENVSGFKEIFKRPAGSNLSNLGSVKNIVSIKPDRLFRSVSDALITTDIWNKKDISVHFVDVGGASLSTKTSIGRLMFTTIISFAEFERNVTGERTCAVLNNKKSTGKVYAGQVLGYDKVDGKLVPNEKEQAIVAEIFKLSNTLSDYMIAKTLNERGVRTKNGKFFVPATIKAIIANSIHRKVA